MAVKMITEIHIHTVLLCITFDFQYSTVSRNIFFTSIAKARNPQIPGDAGEMDMHAMHVSVARGVNTHCERSP